MNGDNLHEQKKVRNQSHLPMNSSKMRSTMQVLVDENDDNGCGKGRKSGTVQYSMRNCPRIFLLRCMGWLEQ
jgi:hypothetical protein